MRERLRERERERERERDMFTCFCWQIWFTTFKKKGEISEN